jgi:hypothetical protein
MLRHGDFTSKFPGGATHFDIIPIQPFVKPANGQWEARSQEFWTNNYCGT